MQYSFMLIFLFAESKMPLVNNGKADQFNYHGNSLLANLGKLDETRKRAITNKITTDTR